MIKCFLGEVGMDFASAVFRNDLFPDRASRYIIDINVLIKIKKHEVMR